MASGYWSPLAIATADGPVLTTTAAGGFSCLPITALYTFPPNSIGVGTMLRVRATGRISTVTTSGTARFDLRLNNLVIFDTGAMNLNTVAAKTTLPWWLEIMVTCRAVGTVGTASFMGMASFQTEAIIGSPLGTVGGSGSLLSAVSTGVEGAPVSNTLGSTTVSNPFDCFFTQTVTSGSLTVHQFVLDSGSVALT